jgi:hypothetical protein
MHSDLNRRRACSYPAGKRVQSAADPCPYANLLGPHALDGQRAFDDGHNLVGAVSLAERSALDAVPISLVARRAADPLSRGRTAVSNQRRCRGHQLADALLCELTKDVSAVRADICDRSHRYVAQRTCLLLVARSPLLWIDVDAHHHAHNRRDNKITAISRLLRCFLPYLQFRNAWEQSASPDVVAKPAFMPISAPNMSTRSTSPRGN